MARCRLARAPARSPVSRSAIPRNAWLAAGGGIELDALRSSARAVPGAAVPQRDPEAVVRLGTTRVAAPPRAPGGGGRRGGLSAGPARSPGGCARPRGSRPGGGPRSRCSRAPRRSPRSAASLRPLVGSVGRARRRGAASCGGRPRALLLQGGAERVVGFALLGIDLERSLERGDGARQVAALAQRLPELVVDLGRSSGRPARRCGGASAPPPGRPVSRRAMPRLKWAPRLFGSSARPSGRPRTASA